jgi:hypothetical protein
MVEEGLGAIAAPRLFPARGCDEALKLALPLKLERLERDIQPPTEASILFRPAVGRVAAVV